MSKKEMGENKMKLTFDQFATWVFFAFFSAFGFIFWNIWQSVDDLNKNMAILIVDLNNQKQTIIDHNERIKTLERGDYKRR